MAVNILEGGIADLAKMKGDLADSIEAKKKLDGIKQNQSKTEKQLQAKRKEYADTLEKEIKKKRDEVISPIDKEISAEQAELKNAKDAKSKAKEIKVQDRIKGETAGLNEEIAEKKKEISDKATESGAPIYTKFNWFYTLYLPSGIREYLILAAIALVAFLIIPGAVCLLLPDSMQEVFPMILIYGGISLFMFFLYNLFEKMVFFKHSDTLIYIKERKQAVKMSQNEIKKITKDIRNDTDEEMYELGEYDARIKECEERIGELEAKKEEALKHFENETKPEIEKNMQAQYGPIIEEFERQIIALKYDASQQDALVKSKEDFISKEYESYLGKDMMKIEKVDELIQIIKDGKASKVSLAVQILRAR